MAELPISQLFFDVAHTLLMDMFSPWQLWSSATQRGFYLGYLGLDAYVLHLGRNLLVLGSLVEMTLFLGYIEELGCCTLRPSVHLV